MFNKKLQGIREKKGYTIQYVASSLGVKAKVVEKWESGKAELPASMLPALAKIYECAIDTFFEEEWKDNREQMEARLEELEDYLADLEDKVSEAEEEIDELKEKLGINEEKLTPEQIAYLKPLFEETRSSSSSSTATDDFEKFAELVVAEIETDDRDNKITTFLDEHEQLHLDFIRVLNILEETNSASISLIQRRLSVGYNKAGRMLDALEKMGVVTEFNGACARKIKIARLQKIKELLGI